MKIKGFNFMFQKSIFKKNFAEQYRIFNYKNCKVFMDVEVDGKKLGRMTFEIYSQYLPLTSMNFINLCKGISKNGKTYSYKNTKFHKIVPGMLTQGGKISEDNSVTYYGNKFNHENYLIGHSEPGIISMVNDEFNTNGSQFFITTSDCSWLDGKNVAFGKISEGIEILNEIELCGNVDGSPLSEVVISDCGVLTNPETYSESNNDHHNHHDNHNEHSHNNHNKHH